MANSNTPYTREGDINAWNDLIRKINLQAAECNLVPLEEVAIGAGAAIEVPVVDGE